MRFEPEERAFIACLNDRRLYSTAVLAHLSPGRGPDPFAAKCRLLDKLNALVLIRKRLPEPDGVNRLGTSTQPAWYGWRWKRLILDESESDGIPPTKERDHGSTSETSFRFLPEEEAYLRTLSKDRLYSPSQIAQGLGDPYLKHQVAYYGGTRKNHREWLYRKLAHYAVGALANPHGVIGIDDGQQLAWTGQRWIQLVENVNWP